MHLLLTSTVTRSYSFSVASLLKFMVMYGCSGMLIVQLHSVLALYCEPNGAPSVMLPDAAVICVSTAHSCVGDNSLLQARLMGP